MKATGIVRRIDDLGRIVIPKEIRKNLHIQDGEPLEINVMDRSIMLTPYSPLPALSIQSDLFLRVMAKELKTGTAICSSTAILSYRNVSLYRDCSLSDEIRSRIQSQQQYEYDPEKAKALLCASHPVWDAGRDGWLSTCSSWVSKIPGARSGISPGPFLLPAARPTWL